MEGKRYMFTRKELKELKASEFRDGDIVLCGKYRIWIRYGNYDHARMHTRVSTRDDLRDMSMGKWPQYIKEFIERR